MDLATQSRLRPPQETSGDLARPHEAFSGLGGPHEALGGLRTTASPLGPLGCLGLRAEGLGPGALGGGLIPAHKPYDLPFPTLFGEGPK